MRVKEESEKAGLKLNIKKMKIIASCLITSWQINGEKLDTGTDFIFLGSKITVEINSENSLEGLILKLLYCGHLMQRADSLEKTLMLRKIEGKRRKGQQRMRRLGSITDSMDINLHKLGEIVEDRGAWHITVHGVTESQTRLNDSTTTVQESELQCPSGNSITFVFKELVMKHRSELKVTFVSHYCSVLAAQWLIDPWR